MTSADLHEDLLLEWQSLPHHVGKIFAQDGIIDPEYWASSPCRVLFLLKEAYFDPKKASLDVDQRWDLRRLVRDDEGEPRGNIALTEAEWAYAIHCIAERRDPRLPDRTNHAELRKALLSSAIVNVKKSDGKRHSDDDDIAWYAREDGPLLRQQVDNIAPDVIICGKVWEHVKFLWKPSKLDLDAVWREGYCTIVDYWHPANQFPRLLNYYTLVYLLTRAGVYRHS